MTNWNGPESQKFYLNLFSNILVRPMDFLFSVIINQAFKAELRKERADSKYLIAMLLMRTYMKLDHSDPVNLQSCQEGV